MGDVADRADLRHPFFLPEGIDIFCADDKIRAYYETCIQSTIKYNCEADYERVTAEGKG